MVKKDYYEILGVKKTDSSETIKKSYKKLALKYHPDKAGDDKKKKYEESFKEINEAYSTLSDPEKRKKYDSGESGFSQGSPFSQGSGFEGGDLSDILRDLFRNGSFGSQFSDDDSTSGQDLRYQLEIEFGEAVFGVEKELSINKDIFCESCKGDGSEDKKFEKCDKCGGHGAVKMSQRTPFGLISRTIRCDKCDGVGKTAENKCKRCHGAGILSGKDKVKVKIPAGIDDSQTLRVRHGGNAIKNGAEGDLFLVIRVRPHKIFKREGFDVYMDLPISFAQAALGADISILTLSSEEIKIKIDKGTESGSILRLKGRGIPYLNHPNRRGDQFVNIVVKTPKKLSKSQVKLFEELAKLD